MVNTERNLQTDVRQAHAIAHYAELCAKCLFAVDDIGFEIRSLMADLDAGVIPQKPSAADIAALAGNLAALRVGFDNADA